MVNIMDDNTREITFGEKAVGLSFNPSQNTAVQDIKVASAALIDILDNMRTALKTDGEVFRMLSIAITEAQTAQMWGVKAVTWDIEG